MEHREHQAWGEHGHGAQLSDVLQGLVRDPHSHVCSVLLFGVKCVEGDFSLGHSLGSLMQA